MTISDLQHRELEARGTMGSTMVGTAALSLALALAQYGFSQKETYAEGFRLTITQGTLSQPCSLQIGETDVFVQINRVYDELLRNQVELDSESKHALYANLWDLYT